MRLNWPEQDVHNQGVESIAKVARLLIPIFLARLGVQDVGSLYLVSM